MQENVQCGGSKEAYATRNLAAEGRNLDVPDKIAWRNGGVVYLSLNNKSTTPGQFVAGSLVCSLKDPPEANEEFWIFACPLWSFRTPPKLESGFNLLELAVQGFRPNSGENDEWIRHASYVYRMARLRTLGYLRAASESDAAKAKAGRIFSFVEGIAAISNVDDGFSYSSFEAVKDDVACYLQIVTIEPSGLTSLDKVRMSPIGIAFLLANYPTTEMPSLVAEFRHDLAVF